MSLEAFIIQQVIHSHIRKPTFRFAKVLIFFESANRNYIFIVN